MKSLHRCKAIETYKAARVVLNEGYIYSSYILLKEATRSTLAYINEDIQGKEYSEKTKMRTLLDEVPPKLMQDFDLDVFNLFVDMEKDGLSAILALDIKKLKEIKRVLKRIISIYLDENL